MLEKIDYIKGLGVDTVWLSSFFQNDQDDENSQNYEWDDITDHTKVGQRFGTEDDLNELLTAFEENGKTSHNFL